MKNQQEQQKVRKVRTGQDKLEKQGKVQKTEGNVRKATNNKSRDRTARGNGGSKEQKGLIHLSTLKILKQIEL